MTVKTYEWAHPRTCLHVHLNSLREDLMDERPSGWVEGYNRPTSGAHPHS